MSDSLLMAAFIHESLKERALLVSTVGPTWNRYIMTLICNPGGCSQASFGLWSYIFTSESNCYMLVCSVSCCFPACQRYVMLLKLFISKFILKDILCLQLPCFSSPYDSCSGTLPCWQCLGRWSFTICKAFE